MLADLGGMLLLLQKLKIYAKPNAKHTALLKVVDGVLHIAIHARPQEGEANKELIRFLAELLDVPKTQVILEKGETSKHKTVIVPLTDNVRKFIESNPPRNLRHQASH